MSRWLLSGISLAVSLGFLGCASTINRSQMSTSLDVNMESNLSADIEVDLTKQLRGTARQKVVFWFFDLEAPEYYADGVSYNKASNQSSLFSFTSGLTDSVKAAAAYRAVAESKADLIVFPQYTIKAVSTFLGFYREITATVYGYPGTIKAIKPADVAKFNKKSAKE